MTDQGSTTYSSVISEMTHGHQWLHQTLNLFPRNGWSIDPFGHSPTLAFLYKKMGFDFHVIGRISEPLRRTFRSNKSLEMMWLGAGNGVVPEEKTKMFTKILYSSYCTPSPFLWEGSYPDSEYDPEANPPVTEANLDSVAHAFYAEVVARSETLVDPTHVFFPLGCDFTFRSPSLLYGNMTMVMEYILGHPDKFNHMNIMYSKVSEYMNNLLRSSSKAEYPTYTGDFFLYDDYPQRQSYYSGLLVSNPGVKLFHRYGEKVLRFAEVLHVVLELEECFPAHDLVDLYASILQIRAKLAQLNHHDAITGTERFYVAEFYMEELLDAIQTSKRIISRGLAAMLFPDSFAKKNSTIAKLVTFTNPFMPFQKTENIEEEEEEPTGAVGVVVFNTLGWALNDLYVSFQIGEDVAKSAFFITYGPDPTSERLNYTVTRNYFEQGLYDVVVDLTKYPLGALGFDVIYLQRGGSDKSDERGGGGGEIEDFLFDSSDDEGLILRNLFMELEFENGTNKLKTIRNVAEEELVEEMSIQFDFYYYIPETGNDTQCSGAYIFRPHSQDPPHLVTDTAQILSVEKNELFEAVTLQFSDYIKMRFVLNANQRSVGVDYWIGPLPPNREVVVKVSTEIANDRAVYIDQLGLDNTKKVFNAGLPLQANFFPFIYRMYMQDDSRKLSVLTNKAQSVGITPKEGEVEIMVHRRMSSDDNRGRDEAMDDDSTVEFHSILFFESLSCSEDAEVEILQSVYKLNYPVRKAFLLNEAAEQKVHKYEIDHLFSELPPNIHLVTLNMHGQEKVLRLVNVNSNSSDTHVYFHKFFNEHYQISEVMEMSLSLLHEKGYSRLRDSVKMSPLDVRTFRVIVRQRKLNYELLYIFVAIFGGVTAGVIFVMTIVLFIFVVCKKMDKREYQKINY